MSDGQRAATSSDACAPRIDYCYDWVPGLGLAPYGTVTQH